MALWPGKNRPTQDRGGCGLFGVRTLLGLKPGGHGHWAEVACSIKPRSPGGAARLISDPRNRFPERI